MLLDSYLRKVPLFFGHGIFFPAGLFLILVTFPLFSEFINLVSSESNEVCNREEKRTIAPEHVLKALQVFASSKVFDFFYRRSAYLVFL